MSHTDKNRSSSSWRMTVFILAGLLTVSIWIAMGVSIWLGLPSTVTIPLVVASALAGEGLFWLGAVLLGWSVFANRRKVWERLTSSRSEETTP